jgi:hypothetical protein
MRTPRRPNCDAALEFLYPQSAISAHERARSYPLGIRGAYGRPARRHQLGANGEWMGHSLYVHCDAPNGTINAMISSPLGTTYCPLDPEQPDSLPKLRGIDYDNYLRFLAAQKSRINW